MTCKVQWRGRRTTIIYQRCLEGEAAMSAFLERLDIQNREDDYVDHAESFALLPALLAGEMSEED